MSPALFLLNIVWFSQKTSVAQQGETNFRYTIIKKGIYVFLELERRELKLQKVMSMDIDIFDLRRVCAKYKHVTTAVSKANIEMEKWRMRIEHDSVKQKHVHNIKRLQIHPID